MSAARSTVLRMQVEFEQSPPALMALPLRTSSLHPLLAIRPTVALRTPLQARQLSDAWRPPRSAACAAAGKRRARARRRTHKSVPSAPVDEQSPFGDDEDELDGDAAAEHGSSGRYRPGILETCRALVLDTSYRPIRVVGWQRAVRSPPAVLLSNPACCAISCTALQTLPSAPLLLNRAHCGLLQRVRCQRCMWRNTTHLAPAGRVHGMRLR